MLADANTTRLSKRSQAVPLQLPHTRMNPIIIGELSDRQPFCPVVLSVVAIYVRAQSLNGG